MESLFIIIIFIIGVVIVNLYKLLVGEKGKSAHQSAMNRKMKVSNISEVVNMNEPIKQCQQQVETTVVETTATREECELECTTEANRLDDVRKGIIWKEILERKY